MLLEALRQHNWEKYWSGKWSLLSSFYWGKYYTSQMEEHLGHKLKFAVLISKNGASSCYFEEEDRRQFGLHLGKKVLADDNYVAEFCVELKRKADALVDFTSNFSDVEINLQKFEKYLEMFWEYTGNHISPRNIIDYLPEEKSRQHLPLFQDARLYTENVFVETEKFMQYVAAKLENKIGRPKHLILCFLGHEFEKIFDEEIVLISAEVLNQRFEHSALVFANGEMKLFCGDEAREIENAVLGLDKRVDVIQGTTAYPGAVVGRVRIVLDPQEAGDFCDGDILVAGMTRPEYVPLMKKAGAIVTDGGGILCHAAIVAREIKKPCVVGAKIATHVLMDGDMIEVDAGEGIVKRL